MYVNKCIYNYLGMFCKKVHLLSKANLLEKKKKMS